MKYLFIILCFFVTELKAQYVPVSNQMFSTATDLRAHVGASGVAIQLNGISSFNDGYGGTFYWDSTSVGVDNNKDTFQVTGTSTGRWIRLKNQNSIKGSVTLSGTALQTAYTVSFGQTLTSTPVMVIVQAYSSNAAVPSWVSSVTTTGFTVNFSSVPILGTNNLSITYLIIKQ